MKKYKISFIIIFGFLLFYIIQGIIEEKHAPCDILNQFMNYDFNGIIIDKFIDSTDHSTKTVIIKDFNQDNLDTLKLLDWDGSGVYYKMKLNDTIFKKMGENAIDLSNKTGKFTYILNFGCDPNK